MGLLNLFGLVSTAQKRTKMRANHVLNRMNAELIIDMHINKSANLMAIVADCGGIGDAQTALTHHDMILTHAFAMTQSSDLVRGSLVTEEVKHIQASYKYAQALYLQKRLGQIQIAARPEDFPLLLDSYLKAASHHPFNARLKAYFKHDGDDTSISPEDRLAYILPKEFKIRIDKLNQFKLDNGKKMDIHLDMNVIAFISSRDDEYVSLPALGMK